MFTGLVQTVGSVARIERRGVDATLRIACRYTDFEHGESIAVDGCCLSVVAHEKLGDALEVTFEVPAPLAPFLAPKGSICIDGVSLTVNQVGGRRFDVNIIPHTRDVTTLGELVVDAGVNVEIDVIARYIDRLLPAAAGLRKE